MIKKSYFIMLLLATAVISCTSGDPYEGSSRSSNNVVRARNQGTNTSGNSSNTNKENTPKNTPKNNASGEVDNKFDATDEKIVAFIDQKVYEDAAQIKQVTIDSLNKLLKEKNIRMTKREFLARTYQIIRDNNMNSFYLAAGRLLNQLK